MKMHMAVWLMMVCSVALTAKPIHYFESSPFTSTNSEPFIDTLTGRCMQPKFKRTWVDVVVEGKERFKLDPVQDAPQLVKPNFSTEAFFYRAKASTSGEKGQKQYAPLMVVMPGIFNAAFDDGALGLAKYFHNKNFHVLVLPNPWSKHFMTSATRPMGDVLYEAEAMLEIIEKFQNRYKNYISTTHMAGISYGGFLAAISAQIDASESRQLIDGNVLLLGSPLNLIKAMHNLDHFIEDTDSYSQQRSIFADYQTYNYICSGYDKSKWNLKDNKQKHRFNELSKAVKHLVIFRGFRKNIKTAVTQFDGMKFEGMDIPKLRPSPDDYDSSTKWSNALKEWENNIRFKKYFTDYGLSQLYQELGGEKGDGEKAYLRYWVNETNKLYPNKVITVIAENDFLNTNVDRSGFDKHLTVFASGGHVGFLWFKWFTKRMANVFTDEYGLSPAMFAHADIKP